jgi:hypothetical protein
MKERMFFRVRNRGTLSPHRHCLLRSCTLAAPLWFAINGMPAPAADTPAKLLPHFDLRTRMTVDVDGAPNAYGPRNLPTLDYLRNAHSDGTPKSPIVGYLTRTDHHTPIIQGPHDPCPGYYISTTDFRDDSIDDDANPRKYLDATRISYVVIGRLALRHHVHLGDLVVVHSDHTHKTVYAIAGDTGNASGGEGSLALLQALGYPFRDGKTYAVEQPEIVIRYFPGSNPTHQFFRSQEEIDRAAEALHLDRSF